MNTPNTTTKTPLLTQLQVLEDDHLQAIYAHYGDKGMTLWNQVTDDPGLLRYEEAEKLINTDPIKEQKETLLMLIDEYHKNYVPERSKLKTLEDEAKAAAQSRNEHKKLIASRKATLTKDLRENVSDAHKFKLDEAIVLNEMAIEREKRHELRVKGKRAYFKGVVAAAIDGQADTYIDECTKGAHDVAKRAKTAVASRNDAHLTIGRKEVEKQCRKAIKSAMNYKINPTTAAALKSAEFLDQQHKDK